MYTGPQLINLLEIKHQQRGQSNIFKKATFTLNWRTKVGSFPHPDVETIVSAGEACGAWLLPNGQKPEDKREVGENWNQLKELPLNGYIPASSIRGVLRAWVKKRPLIRARMQELLGYQQGNIIKPGKIEFFDAWSEEPTKLTLDIVNPQQNFQIYHEGQGRPLSLYTLGDGKTPITVTIAIRGIPGKASPVDVDTVWGWLQQALSEYGVGSRTASGYGNIKPPSGFRPSRELNPSEIGYASKRFEFSLCSQGCAGPNTREMELRPCHWRGWLRSWLLRFLLGAMSVDNAEKTVGELMGILEPNTRKGCVRVRMNKGVDWCEESSNTPNFYLWKGNLEISAPRDILNEIIVPVIRFAVSVGGVGRGCRRPLHIFHMETRNGNLIPAARGSQLTLTHQVRNPQTQKPETKTFGLPVNSERWTTAYTNWLNAVQSRWSDKIDVNANQQLAAEVFSPQTCAIYAVPGPEADPVDVDDICWLETNAIATRGEGMHLIYQQTPPQNYKRNSDLGGNAGNENPHCSWVSIKRINIPHKQENTDCQEIVCLFMGGQAANSNLIRSQFLQDLNRQITGAVRLFGVQP